MRIVSGRKRARNDNDNDSRKNRNVRPESGRGRSDTVEKLTSVKGRRLETATAPMYGSGIASVREGASGNGGGSGMAVITPGNAIALALTIVVTKGLAALRPPSPRI